MVCVISGVSCVLKPQGIGPDCFLSRCPDAYCFAKENDLCTSRHLENVVVSYKRRLEMAGSGAGSDAGQENRSFLGRSLR